MDTDYDSKFEEMKKYIPFLESMIKRLENTGSTTKNPRQAQLAKIRSLRDLLLDKKKRMKMENLLKCEQVLINLYAKVEQRDSFSETKNDTDTSVNSNKDQLDFVRNKLKNVVSYLQDTETLPDLPRACKTDDVCTASCNETALFQRRPNKTSISPIRCPVADNNRSTAVSSKRSYTRVLVSPERDPDGWTLNETSHKPLFSRRSPQSSSKISPLKRSPSYNKKGRKVDPSQSSKTGEQIKDLNITLKVPEESLNSLNTKDILSRIINCSDNDVDIDTLRGLRSQILSELKQTGTKDDISDLILKSYKNKKNKKKTAEVEEGELSDSESEVIESIYGSLVVVDKDETISQNEIKVNEKEQEPRKIQICLVINSEKEANNESDNSKDSCSHNTLFDESDFEPFPDGRRIELVDNEVDSKEFKNRKKKLCDVDLKEGLSSETRKGQRNEVDISETQQGLTLVDRVLTCDVHTGKIQQSNIDRSKVQTSEVCDVNVQTSEVPAVKDQRERETNKLKGAKVQINEVQVCEIQANENTSSEISGSDVCTVNLNTKNGLEIDKANDSTSNVTNVSDKIGLHTEIQLHKGFSPNFYKPILNQDNPNTITGSTTSYNLNIKSEEKNECKRKEHCTKLKESVEIPLLDLEATAKQVVQEIDILQALKKEILSEKISGPDSEIVTPPLHQPKLTKVENMRTMLPKKRISIERYKEKSTTAPRSTLFINDTNGNTTKDELLKKQSLKLTEKEYERFNLSGKISFNESSDEEDKGKISPIDDIYNNSAPKSPDHEDFADTGIKPPVIIPADPVKTTVVCSKTDIDMRMMSVLSSTNSSKAGSRASSPTANFDVPKNEAELNVNDKRLPLVDPRMKRDFNYPNMASPNLGFVDNTSRPPINFSSGITPILMPNSIPNMTPNRISQASNIVPNIPTPNVTNTNIYEVSSSRQSFESDGYSNQDHVYAPLFPTHETHDYSDDVIIRDDLRNNSEFQNIYVENNSPIYNLSECPKTPVHPFGVSECPPNSNHSFALLETPMTPIHSFGRSEAPMTPVHPFGRSECPSTPSHSFGRTEVIMTPTHPFGRTEVLMTPTHPFGRNDFSKNQSQITPIRYSKFQDPRVNRSSDYENMSRYNDEKSYDNYKERISSNFNARNYKYDQSKRNYSDSYRSYNRQKSVGRYDNRSVGYEQETRYGERSSRPESSVGHSSSRTNKTDRHYCNDRSKGYRQRDHRYETDNVRSYNDPCGSRRNYRREHSIVRTLPEDRYYERKNDSVFTSEKTLSVHYHAGRSFTIDTSVNRSFQETFTNFANTTLSESNFDARRKRASSVGRFLTREPNDGNVLSDLENKNHPLRSHSNFRRACSVGRDTERYNATKNLFDIKVELQAFKNSDAEKINNNKDPIQRSAGVAKKGNERDPRLSRREQFDIQNGKYESHLTYLRQEHSRESILPREVNKDYQRRNNNVPTKEKSQEIKKHGIIYSTDNIANGTILGLGCGVKNYKIPKIKKPTEEIDNQESTGDIKTISNKIINNTCEKKIAVENRDINPVKHECLVVEVEKNLDADDEIVKRNIANLKEKSAKLEKLDHENKSKEENEIINLNISNNVEKRITRSASRSTISETNIKVCDSPQSKVNKSKKLVLQVPDSDDDNTSVIKFNKNSHNEAFEKNEISTALIPTVVDTNSSSVNNQAKTNVDNEGNATANSDIFKIDESGPLENPVFKEDNNMASDNCFGLELEMFSENIATDPVIENINALIADLDDDLETSKNDGTKNQFTKEINLENMLDNITCVEKKDNCRSYNETKSCTEKVDVNPMIDKTTLDNKLENNQTSEQDHQCGDIKMEHNNEVTTTDQEIVLELLPKSTIQKNLESCSIPDSTIDVNTNTHEDTKKAKVIEEVPDSTNELTCQMNADVTSTYNSYDIKDTVKITSSREVQQQSDSIGSLLSILKDKSKIKELLSMLKDQSSENEKLKKKLEKLSEIVSDDDDDDNQKPNVVCSLSHTPNDSLRKENECEVDQNKESDVNNIREDSFVDNCNIINTQVDKEIYLDNRINSLSSTLSSPWENLKEGSNQVKKIEDQEITHDPDKSSDTEDKNTNDEKFGEIVNNSNENEQSETFKKTLIKNTKSEKYKRKLKNNKNDENKRFTRSEATGIKTGKKPGVKVPSRELKQLQEDIREMFLHDDMFNASGIRMCRLAKLSEDKTQYEKGEQQSAENNTAVSGDILSKGKSSKKKNVSKSKVLQKNAGFDMESTVINSSSESKNITKCKPGPRSKTKVQEQCEVDPYMFESDSVSESNHTNVSESKLDITSESEWDSLGTSRSFESTQQIAEIKKKSKRKRRGWQVGVIKPKQKKKKVETSNCEKETSSSDNQPQAALNIVDTTCFTDKTYCFSKNAINYPCRFCSYDGNEIVHHYKKQHPHLQIPLSRMSPEVAKEAIEQSEEINTIAISKIPTEKYICRFCFKEFTRKKTILEAFFWHVVSAHTGEYKQLCSECASIEKCPFDLDIPPPPKELKGQLLGFICGKCNFTQISLENLKSHVITRHSNEQTEVSVINLSVISQKALSSFTKLSAELEPRRSRRLVHSVNGEKELDHNTDSETETNKTNRNTMKSQITFENDDEDDEKCKLNKTPGIKLESEEEMVAENKLQLERTEEPTGAEAEAEAAGSDEVDAIDCYEETASNDVLDYPHFKMSHTVAGTKEYVCCINGVENHYATALLISFKKHVQIKHKEKWDGFCFICKLIVTPQGDHYFKDCLQHFLDKHMDEFPLIVKEDNCAAQAYDVIQNKNYLNVRPLSELVEQSSSPRLEPTLPVIESVISLGAPRGSSPPRRAAGLAASEASNGNDVNTYEEAQAQIMNQKHNVVLEIMMSREKLVNLFKCAGRFCSYSSDNAEDALRHALVHERMGGENSLLCAYCGFDSLSNSVDLVTHVFKFHAGCQYACAHCFYRAAASQLVRAHAMRKHAQLAAEQWLVLRSTVASPSVLADIILPREVAVPFYMCNQAVNAERCKFKTYTSGKFCEHYRSRHAADDEYSCQCCPAGFPQYSDLLQHMKGHGFKLYQCTWCVHGADNEAELLAHASEEHPNKQPQAYLRVITNKEGAAGYRVLPLAQLNHSKIPTLDIIPNSIKGNPEREAERSLDLEKLIGQTSRMVTESRELARRSPSAESGARGDALRVPFVSELLVENNKSLVLALKSSLFKEAQETSTEPSADHHRSETPVLIEQSTENDIHKQLTPILTINPEQKPLKKINETEIVCLDSDDESSDQNVDFYGQDPAAAVEQTRSEKLKLVPLTSLFKCGLCADVVFENVAGYTRHVAALHPQARQLPCAHCSFRGTKDDVINHYNFDHSVNETRRYICGVCNNKYISLVFAKRHIKEAHNFAKVVVTSKTVTNGKHQFIVGKVTKNRKPSKRKRSNEHDDKTLQPAPKVKKFGPDEINLLPINPILDELVYCALCEFGTKVRLNMVRHLQLHAEQQPVPQTAPVNPVPHLETNEKHFDKMVNLASSSLASRMDKCNRSDQQPAVSSLVSPEAAARYPKFVPDRQRYTCGARGCCYISVDEVMLKYHWETLHSDTNDFHCVHCPPYQHLDTSKQLTASRIIAHLKMHDVRLYACSCCSYYHHRRQMVEKHIAESHSSRGHAMVVREDSIAPPPSVIPASIATPTMDLKPWQCGLCKFKSMLRPEVVDHCAKIHQSKMQYKCMYCAFRTSTLESVQKHQRNAHPDRASETFYFYYREGSIPNEPDGTPRWQKQSQQSGVAETKVKSEALECTEPELRTESSNTDPALQSVPSVDLNIVKRDPDAVAVPECILPDLCNSFGQFCEPNGLKYKCPLCTIVSDESKEAMQSHLYEELQYRKWECGFCSYRAFHKNGLNEHMLTEHRQNREPIELPVDSRVETWIAKALDHQFLLIEKNKQNLAKQRMSPDHISPSPIVPVVTAGPEPTNKYTIKDLENSLGKFGAPDQLSYSCPKCSALMGEENAMRDHLEMELNKIRWCCNRCTEKFQNYHEAQFHCKTAHVAPAGCAATVVEAVRDMAMRSAWISAVVESQKFSMNSAPVPAPASTSMPAPGFDAVEASRHCSAVDNSLLIVRYEERVPTPEMLAPSLRPPSLDSDEDEVKLVIDEPSPNTSKVCPFCLSVSKDLKNFKDHIAQHDNIKPYFCSSCDFNSYRKAVLKHLGAEHDGQSARLLTKAQRSRGPPLKSGVPAAAAAAVAATAVTTATTTATPLPVEDDSARLICLNCEKSFTEHEAKNHSHEYTKPAFAKKGQVVVKCCICLRLHESVEAATAHHHASHPTESLNYAYYKLHHNKRSLYCCGYCEQHFKFWRDLKVHWKATHSSLPLQFSKRLFGGASGDAVASFSDEDDVGIKRKSDGVPAGAMRRMCARKSTTKLPHRAVAKKSTTKLPHHSEPEFGEYSFYGTRPMTHDLDAVRTSLTFGSTDVSFSFKQLSEVINVNPIVLVEDINK